MYLSSTQKKEIEALSSKAIWNTACATSNPVPQELKDEIQVSANIKKIINRKFISYVIQRVLENVVTMGAF